MSENNNSFLYLEDYNSFEKFEPIENDFLTNWDEAPIQKSSKQEIFKITNYNFLKKKRLELMKQSYKRKQWTLEEVNLKFNQLQDHKLSYLVKYKDLSWTQTSTFFSKRSPIQCQHRWTKVLQPNLKKGKWTAEEDRLLLKWVEENGAYKWSKLSLILKGRSSKQIRDRWINNLNPDKMKYFQWSEELDRVLLTKYLEHGSSWVTISKYISHTSENMLKNRFYSLLRSTASKKIKLLKAQKKKEETIQIKPEEQVKNSQDLFIFDLNEATENRNDKSYSQKTKVVKYKKNNYSLSYLLNYLPDLLEEKGIHLDNKINSQLKDEYEFDNKISLENKLEEDKNTNIPVNYNEDRSRSEILTKFFNTLSQKIPNVSHNTIEDKSHFKFKSTILLNLQLTLLHKIFNRLKLQVIQKFFECFKENTMLP
jgi:hypothetical protein